MAESSTRGRVRIGVSGWSYPDWRRTFYPAGLRPRDELSFASRVFEVIEINSTFYGLATPARYRAWHDATPTGFCFAVKGHRYVTHNKKLLDVGTALANVFASGVLELREKLGPILWQLPPTLRFDVARTESFLQLLPRHTGEAAGLAAGHDEHVSDAAAWCDQVRPLRHVLEPRHPSWFVPPLADLARSYGVALACSDSSRWPSTDEVTADLVYVRLHGPQELYASAYDDATLARLAGRLRTWSGGEQPPDARRLTDVEPPVIRRDVFVLFDNDAKALAPAQARRLAELLGSP